MTDKKKPPPKIQKKIINRRAQTRSKKRGS